MKLSYQAAPLCYRPDVITGEFVNVGVLALCLDLESQITTLHFEWPVQVRSRISDFFSKNYDSKNLGFLRSNFVAKAAAVGQSLPKNADLFLGADFEQVKKEFGVGGLSSFFWGPTSSGMSPSVEAAMKALMDDLLLSQIDPVIKTSISDNEHWELCQARIESAVQATGKQDKFKFGYELIPNDPPVHLYWQTNDEKQHILQPISFVCSKNHWYNKTSILYGIKGKLQKKIPSLVLTPFLLEPAEESVRQSDLYRTRLEEVRDLSEDRGFVTTENVEHFINSQAENIAA